MAVITLTTDLGLKDYYVGAIKGAILSNCPSASIVDISHEVAPFNIVEAAFIVKNVYHEFPKGSIHIVSVNALDHKDTRPIALKYNDQYFLGPDNGLFSLIFEKYPGDIVQLNFPEHHSFPSKQLFAKAACHLSNGGELSDIGEEIQQIVQRTTLQPVVQETFIRGSAIYIDNYENVITNITKELFEQVGKQRPFAVFFKRYDNITSISQHYYEVSVGEMLCLFNAAGYLEIAINKGNASSLLGLQVGDTIQIDFV